MIPKEYKDFCSDLARNFDKEWGKVQLKVDFGYQFLEHVPLHAWKPMVKIAVDQWEGWPRNWAKAVKDIYETWRRDAHLGGVGIKYNKDDDVRFPIHLMQQAFDILSTKDYFDYNHFCDQVGMPKTDRDRVENKHRVCKEHGQVKIKLPEVGIRINPKVRRPPVQRYREPGEDF
jgi:hypothetical protein